MNTNFPKDAPSSYADILAKTEEIGFNMATDPLVGALLKTLVASKPNGNILELGTGTGTSLCWMVDGLVANAQLTTVDNDPQLSEIAKGFFGSNPQVSIVCQDGAKWIKEYEGKGFDLVFADAWPGKYEELETMLGLINMGGIYVIDDMQPQPNWPEGHHQKAENLRSTLQNRTDFTFTELNCGSGAILMSKKTI